MNLIDQVKAAAPDGFKAELLVARQMRLAARLRGDQQIAVLCDELEDAAKAGDEERTANARRLLLEQAHLTIKRLPASNVVTAPIAISMKAGMKKGEELGNRLFAFLDKRRKRR